MSDLHVEYRPIELSQVVGQEEVVSALTAMFEQDEISHSFLFTGPSGVGKTTLARIIGGALGCAKESGNLIEFDAASRSGVDDVRELSSMLNYARMDGSNLMFIIDECQSLSKKAWEALLKDTEEPPPYAYFVFCTTEPTKVLRTIKTRCHEYALSEVGLEPLTELVEEVAEEECIELAFDGAADVIAKAAGGSPRQALVNLSKVRNAATQAEVYRLLAEADESKEVIDLARFLVTPRGRTWQQAQKLLRDLQDANPESVRRVVSDYVQKVVLNAKNDGQLHESLRILDLFNNPARGMDDVTLSVFSVVLGDDG